MPKSRLESPCAPLLVLFLLIALTGLSFAQTSDKKDADKTKTAATQEKEKEQAVRTKEKIEITVTAPRVEIPLKRNPAATTVIESQVLQAMPRTIGIDEALKLVPGVKVDNQADGERVHLSIRGQGILT